MVEFNVNVNDQDGKTYKVNVTGQHANVLVRKKIGDEIDGMFLGIPGYTAVITGGSDRDGFVMRPGFHGATRQRLLVSASVGFDPKYPGERRKKTFRGDEVSPEISQINAKITQRGPKPVSELLGAEETEG